MTWDFEHAHMKRALEYAYHKANSYGPWRLVWKVIYIFRRWQYSRLLSHWGAP